LIDVIQEATNMAGIQIRGVLTNWRNAQGYSCRYRSVSIATGGARFDSLRGQRFFSFPLYPQWLWYTHFYWTTPGASFPGDKNDGAWKWPRPAIPSTGYECV